MKPIMRMRTLAITAGSVIVAAVGGGLLFIWLGIYNVAATAQHTTPVFALLELATQRSIARRASGIRVPPLTGRATIERGLLLYRAHCVQCHGAPGVAPEPFALGLTPPPSNLALKAREVQPAELFWSVKYGLKMTAMPAWTFRLSDADLWAVVAFVQQLPSLSPADYRDWARSRTGADAAASLSAESAVRGAADARRGRMALQQYACVTCHEIPGVVGAKNPVGPPLGGIATRKYLAGVLPNTPDNMIRWLRSPQQIDPQTAMPDLRVSERDARDIAAFLDTLR